MKYLNAGKMGAVTGIYCEEKRVAVAFYNFNRIVSIHFAFILLQAYDGIGSIILFLLQIETETFRFLFWRGSLLFGCYSKSVKVLGVLVVYLLY